MNRRELLKGLPLAGVAASLPMLATTGPATARERLDLAIEELKAAAAVVYPNIESWTLGEGQENTCQIVIAAFGPLNPYPEPHLADDVTGTDDFAKWNAWEQANR